MSEWKEYKLSELCELIGGGTPKTSVSEYWNGNIPWLSVTDFNTGRKYCFNAEKKITEKGLKESSTKILKKGQIIISARGTVGVISMLGEDMAFNQSNYGITAKDGLTSNDFLYYLLRDNIAQFISNSYGAVFDTITKQTFEQIIVELPPLPEQTAIAEVLSGLDDKIDLLHRQNKTLEQLAETLFRQWFVEEAEESWEEKPLKEIVTLVVDNRGKTPTTVEYKTDYPLIEVNALNSGTCLINYDVIRKYVTKYTYESWFRKHLKENDIIFSTVGTIGVFSIFLENIGAIAQNLIGLRFEKFSPYFIYCFFKLNVENIINLDIGGVQPSIKVPHLLEMTIKCPPQSLLDAFHNKVDGNFQKIKSNTQQIRTLTQLRDTLLPKLMSGEVRVNQTNN